jgi:DNA polymerase
MPLLLMPDPHRFDAHAIASQAAALAQHLKRSGVPCWPRPRPEQVARWSEQLQPSPQEIRPTETQPLPMVATQTVARPESAMAADQRQPQLDLIRQEVSACQRCEQLASCRLQTVFGEGNPSPRFVFFGEGPGAEEDKTGRPFVGLAGQLLTKMMAACKLQREDVYILNTVKCRPPGNRNPLPTEIENCREYYQRQLAILRPEYIVCLGAISTHELLRNDLPIGQLRGQLHRYFESKVLVTYHPAYLLRNPAAKKAAWQDLQLLMRDAGIPLS